MTLAWAPTTLPGPGLALRLPLARVCRFQGSNNACAFIGGAHSLSRLNCGMSIAAGEDDHRRHCGGDLKHLFEAEEAALYLSRRGPAPWRQVGAAGAAAAVCRRCPALSHPGRRHGGRSSPSTSVCEQMWLNAATMQSTSSPSRPVPPVLMS